jgi:hypothetical protein
MDAYHRLVRFLIPVNSAYQACFDAMAAAYTLGHVQLNTATLA